MNTFTLKNVGLYRWAIVNPAGLQVSGVFRSKTEDGAVYWAKNWVSSFPMARLKE